MKKHKRLFFALMPDESVRRQLADLQVCLPQAQGNWVHPQDLHMTLQFLGAVDSHQHACIANAARITEEPSFDLEISHVEYWAKPRMVLAVPQQSPPTLLQLVKTLGNNLSACGFAPEKRAYRPHITLLRKTSPMPRIELPETVCWRVNRFVLLESRPDSQPPWYTPVESWSLR